uniref:hypothetical protein n=1 Tax=Ruegeria arenilitoris TaxID=1173585 RepID=UPI00147FC345|nr:hypothetical protein [Ruegeria arenilitoris]
MNYETHMAISNSVQGAMLLTWLGFLIFGMTRKAYAPIDGLTFFGFTFGVPLVWKVLVSYGIPSTFNTWTEAHAVNALMLIGQGYLAYFVGTVLARRASMLNRNWTWGLWIFMPFAVFMLPFVGPKTPNAKFA